MNTGIPELDALIATRRVFLSLLETLHKEEILTKKEHDVVYMRSVECATLEETGKHFGLVRETIRQIEAKALEKIRNRSV